MNYEKKYKEALGWMQSVYPTMIGAVKEDAEHFFPELKESEDEKIRQFLVREVTETSDEIMSYRNMNKKDVLAWLEKQKEQKPTIEMKTPEESLGIDSETYNKIVDECIYGEQKPADTEKGVKGNGREIPFSEQEWSEEDEVMLRTAKDVIFESDDCSEGTTYKLIDWLKSLKDRVQPQTTWKPSDEQMKFLHKYAEQNNYSGAILTSLYNDLIQLKRL